jgi:hypothetical protein
MDFAQALLCLVTFTGGHTSTTDKIEPSCNTVETSEKNESRTVLQNQKINFDFHRIGVEDGGRISVMAAGFQHSANQH